MSQVIPPAPSSLDNKGSVIRWFILVQMGTNGLITRVYRLEGEVTQIQNDIVTIKAEIVTINNEIVTINNEIATIQANIATISNEITTLQSNVNTLLSGKGIPQYSTAPAYSLGQMYFDTTLNKLRIGGASGWETITSS